MSQGAQLTAAAPESHHARLVFAALGEQFVDDQDDQVLVRVIAQSDVSQSKEGIDRWMNGHRFFIIFGGRLWKFGEAFGNLGQELLYADC